jgi:transposase, IS30 family
MSKEERYRMTGLKAAGHGIVAIAKELGRHRTTIWRELRRNVSKHDGHYRAAAAQMQANGRLSRSRRKTAFNELEWQQVATLLNQDWSPEQISGHLKKEGGLTISHETIYRRLWADKKSGGRMWEHLRGARKQRRKRYGRYDSRGRLEGKKRIGERPAEVETRQRLGDWEIDLVHGKGTDCVLTMVDRKSGLLRLRKLRRARKEETTQQVIAALTSERVVTITSDNGSEFHDYQKIEAATKASYYFCTPHHAWERGSNENTNGLLRQYLPKGMDMSKVSAKDCLIIESRINQRPRKRHGYRTPNEIHYEKV